MRFKRKLNPPPSSRLRDMTEVVERHESIAFGEFDRHRREALLVALDFEHARPFLRSGVDRREWPKPASVRDVERMANDLVELSVEQMANHWAESSGRSVIKLREWAWLLGRDDVVEAMDDVPFEMYGAPKFRQWCQGMGRQYPAVRWAVRMSMGRPCRENCDQGCLG